MALPNLTIDSIKASLAVLRFPSTARLRDDFVNFMAFKGKPNGFPELDADGTLLSKHLKTFTFQEFDQKTNEAGEVVLALNAAKTAALVAPLLTSSGGAAATTPTLSSIAIGGPSSLSEGATTTFPVTATYSDGTTQLLSSGVSYTVTEGTVAANGAWTVPTNTATGDGRLDTITASVGGKVAAKQVTIVDTSVAPAAPSGGDKTVLTITYAAAPAAGSLGAQVAKFLYDKRTVEVPVLDDGLVDAVPLATALAAAGAPKMTDGAGNAVPYTFTIAPNAYTNYNNNELAASGGGNLTFAQTQALVAAGHDLSNHGLYHGLTPPPGAPGGGFAPVDIADNVARMHQYVYDKYGFIMRTGVRPNNDQGYIPDFMARGYLAGTSQGSENSFPFQGESWQRPIALEGLPAGYVHLYRDFITDSSQATTDAAKARFDMALADSSAASHRLHVVGVHNFDQAVMLSLFQHIKEVGNDMVWVASLHRVLEYRDTASKVQITDVLSGNTRTITLDYANCSPLARRDDLSLLTSAGGAAIASVAVSGGGATVTHNPATGLINVLRPRTFTSINGRPRSAAA